MIKKLYTEDEIENLLKDAAEKQFEDVYRHIFGVVVAPPIHENYELKKEVKKLKNQIKYNWLYHICYSIVGFVVCVIIFLLMLNK